jgi:predicted dehydrogenase
VAIQPTDKDQSMKRREFLKASSAASLGLLAGHWLPRARAAQSRSAAASVNVAVLGTNSRGSALAAQFAQLPNVQVTYICDPDDKAAAKGVDAVKPHTSTAPKVVRDFRRALDDKDVDALVIAMPDHWHAPATILAMHAGKHVYLEKPCSHNPAEGEMLIAVQNRYPELKLQMGNQRRSSAGIAEAVELLKDGAIGRPFHAEAWYCRKRGPIGRGKVVPVPQHLDYEIWQGPAPRKPYRDNVIHYNWHWFWNWGTGETCNNGCHELDVCRWALGVEYPERVTSSGGRFRYEDDWEFYDIQQLGIEFPGRKSISWQGHSVDQVKRFGLSRGTMIFGEQGQMLITESAYKIFDHDGKVVREYGQASGGDTTDTRAPTKDLTKAHCGNLLDCIRNGGTPHSEIEGGHKSVLLCHLGNIAQKFGRALKIDPKTGHIVGDPEAMQLWAREYEPGWKPRI